MDKRQRSIDLETLAHENGWVFSTAGPVPAMGNFEFQTGEKRKVERIENLIEGADFKCFDVCWQAEFNVSDAFGPLAHKNMTAKNARQQTVFLFESADLHLPKIHVYPANSGNWIDKIFRRSDSDFEKRWTIFGNSNDFFSKNVIEFYDQSDEFWTFAVDNLIFIYQPNLLIEPLQISDWASRISTLANLLRQK